MNLYKIKKNEKESFYDNLDKIWIHGLLHLLGHAHEKNKDYKKMNKEEKNFLALLQGLMISKIINNKIVFFLYSFFVGIYFCIYF